MHEQYLSHRYVQGIGEIPNRREGDAPTNGAVVTVYHDPCKRHILGQTVQPHVVLVILVDEGAKRMGAKTRYRKDVDLVLGRDVGRRGMEYRQSEKVSVDSDACGRGRRRRNRPAARDTRHSANGRRPQISVSKNTPLLLSLLPSQQQAPWILTHHGGS